MGRLFSSVLLSVLLIYAPAYMQEQSAQPVFFSMLFPHLIPAWPEDTLPHVHWRSESGAGFGLKAEETKGEAMRL